MAVKTYIDVKGILQSDFLSNCNANHDWSLGLENGDYLDDVEILGDLEGKKIRILIEVDE